MGLEIERKFLIHPDRCADLLTNGTYMVQGFGPNHIEGISTAEEPVLISRDVSDPPTPPPEPPPPPAGRFDLLD